MTQTQITSQILKASAKAFQRVSTLQGKYGIEATHAALAEIGGMAGVKRLRVYGKEAGGIGPA